MKTHPHHIKRTGRSLATLAILFFSLSRAGAGETLLTSPDGKKFALGKRNGTVEICDAATGTPHRTLSPLDRAPHPSSAINWRPNLAFSPDGQLLAVAVGSEPVSLWNTGNGEKLKTLPQFSVGYDLTFSPDGKLLAGIGMDGKAGPNRCTIWNLDTGEVLLTRTMDAKMGARFNYHRFIRVVFPAGGEVFAIETMEDGWTHVAVHGRAKGERILKQKVEAWSFSGDGQVLVARQMTDPTGTKYGHALWDTATGQRLVKLGAP